jgi:Stage II sporulation protein E (SpoIIE)
MTTAPQLQNQPYRIPRVTIWGGIEPVNLDVCKRGVIAGLNSTTSGGERGGDIYYIDRFLLYTCGLSEATDLESDEEFGEKESPALLEAQADSELASVRDALIERASAFSGGPLLTDDRTLMAVEVP